MRQNGAIGGRIRHLHRQRAIGEQHLRAGNEADAEMLAQQQCTKSGAVDKQVARDLAGLHCQDGGNISILRRPDSRDIGGDMADAKNARAVLLKKPRKRPGIEMIGVVRHRIIFGGRDRFGCASRFAQRFLRANRGGERAIGNARQPLPGHVSLEIALRQHQRVGIGVALRVIDPTNKSRPLLERGTTLVEEMSSPHRVVRFDC